MRRQTHFFATKEDLAPGLKAVEAARHLKYVLCGMFESPTPPVYSSLPEVERFGLNFTGSHATGDRYLVLRRDDEISLEPVPQDGGRIRFAVSQRSNPSSVVLSPGGLYKASALICGHLGTALENKVSSELFRALNRAITSGFIKVGSYYVGPDALRRMDEGLRFVTIDVKSPPEFDLKRHT